MTISFECPGCGTEYEAPDDLAGRPYCCTTDDCPSRHTLRVPRIDHASGAAESGAGEQVRRRRPWWLPASSVEASAQKVKPKKALRALFLFAAIVILVLGIYCFVRDRRRGTTYVETVGEVVSYSANRDLKLSDHTVTFCVKYVVDGKTYSAFKRGTSRHFMGGAGAASGLMKRVDASSEGRSNHPRLRLKYDPADPKQAYFIDEPPPANGGVIIFIVGFCSLVFAAYQFL